MTFALVGSAGTVVVTSGGADLSPAWGTGESPTAAGDLGILQDAQTVATTQAASPAGWTLANYTGGGSGQQDATYVWYVASLAANTAAPTVTHPTSGAVQQGRLLEFSPGGTLDQNWGAAGTASPVTATAPASDTASGALIVISASVRLSSNANPTLGLSCNNATLTTISDATNGRNHYIFGYGVTTSNATADTVTFTLSTGSITGACLSAATFQPASPSVVVPLQAPIVSQAPNRSLTY